MKTHNWSKTKTYKSWIKMRERCTNENAVQWKWYGGRGIKVCNRWMDSFENFLKDMGKRPDGMTLDRINPDGDYEPSNCRWADRNTQVMGQRHVIWVKYRGKDIRLVDLCRDLGLPWYRTYYRYRVMGKPLEIALKREPLHRGE